MSMFNLLSLRNYYRDEDNDTASENDAANRRIYIQSVSQK